MQRSLLWICKIFIVFYCTSILALESKVSLKNELYDCLKNCWGVDPHTAAFIQQKFSPLITNKTHHPVVKKFINISKKQKINFSPDKKIQSLHKDDGVLKSPNEHLIVFESPYVRILLGSTESGAREPLHTHHWKSVMITIRPTVYEIEYANGSKERLDCPIDVVELPAGEKYACTNLGKEADESLRFEIKE